MISYYAASLNFDDALELYYQVNGNSSCLVSDV